MDVNARNGAAPRPATARAAAAAPDAPLAGASSSSRRTRARKRRRALQLRRIKAYANDGKITPSERRKLLAPAVKLTRNQVKQLKRALLVTSQGGRKLTNAEASAILSNKPLPKAPPAPPPVAPPAAPPVAAPAPPAPAPAPATPAPLDLVGGPKPLTGTNAAGYRLSSFPTSGGGGGQTDSLGNLYVAVPGEIRVFDANNQNTKLIPLPFTPVDVAPSPDGSVLYAVQPMPDGTKPVRKLTRGADGNYSVDPNFALQPFNFGGAARIPEGYRIATDGSGNLYVADGVWTKNILHTVVKYDANGNFVTRFGQYVDGNPGDASSWEKGKFYWGLAGIAVSKDGKNVYTTEIGNNRVQRWDVQATGGYTVGATWGNTQADDPNRTGSAAPGKFAAPYDIGVDDAGDVYVANTTATQIQKFTRDGTFVTSMYVGSGGPDAPTANERAHGIAVTSGGDAISTETGRMMERP